MQKIFFAFALCLLALGTGFSMEESEYYHYCFRLCCLNQDAIYTEGPPQECRGAGPDFSENLERCHAQCLYEMNITGGVVGGGKFVEYVDRGVVYTPPNVTEELEPEPESEPEEGPEAEIEEEEEPAPEPAEEPVAEEAEGGEEEKTGPEEIPVEEGGLCAAVFALLLGLFIVKM